MDGSSSAKRHAKLAELLNELWFPPQDVLVDRDQLERIAAPLCFAICADLHECEEDAFLEEYFPKEAGQIGTESPYFWNHQNIGTLASALAERFAAKG